MELFFAFILSVHNSCHYRRKGSVAKSIRLQNTNPSVQKRTGCLLMSPDIFQTPATPLVDTVVSSLALGQEAAGDLNARFLQLELQRINLLILRHFLGQNYMNEGLPEGFRGLAVDREEVFQTLAKIDQSDFSPSLDQNLLNDLRDRSEVLLEQAAHLCADGFQPNLYRLTETCQLSSAEYHAFLICLSSAFNLGYEKVFGYLNNDVTRRYPSRDLIIQVLRTGAMLTPPR